MGDEWGPWIEHDGLGVPECVVGVVCQAVAGNGMVVEAIRRGPPGPGRNSWTWPYADEAMVQRIIRYRTRKPRGLTIIEEIAQGIREPEDA